MNILIDICHPAHVHLYKNFYSVISKKHKVIVTTKKNLLSSIDLLKIYKIPHILIGSKSDIFNL